MNQCTGADAIMLPESVVEEWQGIVDLVARLADVPAALIMRLVKEDIEVFRSSRSEGNPYHPGDSEHFMDSGLYCETVIRSNGPLLVPDALADPDWADNPDIKLNMISYLGFPILLPNKEPFGTLCVLDSKPNAYNQDVKELMEKLRDLLQSHLELIYMNHMLGEERRRFVEYAGEIQRLRDMIPICAHCKKIRDDDGFWESVEEYFEKHTDTRFTHGICPECKERYFPQYAKD